MPSNADFVAAARAWDGTRWVHQGRSRMGIDCVGLILVSLADIGIIIPDLLGYRKAPDPLVFLGHIRAHSLHATEPLPGTFGIFRGGAQPCHVGIFAEMYGVVSLIHAYAGVGKVIEEPFIHNWPNDLIEIRSIEGLT